MWPGTGVDEALLAGESFVRAGVEHRAATRGERGGFVGGGQAIGGPRAGGELAGAAPVGAGAGFDGLPSGGHPCGEAAVEHAASRPSMRSITTSRPAVTPPVSS